MFQYVHHSVPCTHQADGFDLKSMPDGFDLKSMPIVNFSPGGIEDIVLDRRKKRQQQLFVLNVPSSEFSQCKQCFNMTSKIINLLGLNLSRLK